MPINSNYAIIHRKADNHLWAFEACLLARAFLAIFGVIHNCFFMSFVNVSEVNVMKSIVMNDDNYNPTIAAYLLYIEHLLGLYCMKYASPSTCTC